jgi:meromycolic acid 3-oxoacyl-[acyl-carrier protein] synthase II
MAVLRTGDGFPNVVVTAVASTNSIATDAEDTWRLLLDGKSGIRPLDRPFVAEFDLPVHIGGPLLEDFDHHLNRVELRRFSYLQKMATVLSRRLWTQAGLDGTDSIDTRRLMVSIGLALGTAEEIVIQYDAFKEKGMRAVSPLAVQMYMPNAPSAAVALERRAQAGIVTPLMADASGAAAISEAWRHIVLGEADVAICGGIDTWIGPVTIAAFSQMDMLSTHNEDPAGACRPFDADRDGTVFSEAGAMLMVESEEHAVARGAPILGRVMGAAVTSDGYDPVQPDPSGESAAVAIGRAIELAGLTPGDIDLVTADAAGTRAGDLAEAKALRHVLGGHAPAVYAPKSALGHSWGASGAIDAVLTVQALRDQVVPPTLNLEKLDPEVDLDVVSGSPRRGDYRYALTDCFGFGGHNVALVFGAA